MSDLYCGGFSASKINVLLVSERFTAPCCFLYMRVAHDTVFLHLWVTWFTSDNCINHNINFILIYQDWWYCMAYQYTCWRPWMLEWKNALWVCTLSPFALLMARRGLSTRNTRRIFTTDMALELNTEITTNKWMNQWISELSDRWTLTARRKRWGTRWRPEGPGGWRRFCRRTLDEGKLHTQSSEQHTGTQYHFQTPFSQTSDDFTWPIPCHSSKPYF